MENGFRLDDNACSMRLVSVTNRDALNKPLDLTLRWLERGATLESVPANQIANAAFGSYRVDYRYDRGVLDVESV